MKGFTLLEIVISMFLLTSVLVGLHAVLLSSMCHAKHAYQLTLAAEQMISMSEKIKTWKNHPGLEEQINRWNQRNHMLLPQGEGQVIGDFPIFSITLHWGNPPYDCQSLHVGRSNCLTLEVYAR